MYVDQSMLDPIQHSESVVSSSCLKAFPLEFVDHACNAPWCSGRVVVKNVTVICFIGYSFYGFYAWKTIISYTVTDGQKLIRAYVSLSSVMPSLNKSSFLISGRRERFTMTSTRPIIDSSL